MLPDRWIIFCIRSLDDAEVSVEVSPDRCYLELHDISCKGASFVRKDMLDLSEFFIKGSTFNLGMFVSQRAVHKLVIVDEIALSHFDDFDGDDQGDGDHGVHEDEIG